MSLGRILIFFGIISGITLGTHYYLWARLIRDPMWPSPWRQVATIALIVLALSIPASMLAWRTLPRNLAIPVSWVGYVWMGSMFLLLVLLWGGELARWSWVKYASFASVNGGRREFLAQLLAGGAGVFGLALSGWGVWSAIRPVEVKRVAVRLRKLPESLNGLRLVQLTDMHVGLTIGGDFVEDVVRKVNALEPDIVAITGDLIDGSVEDLGDAIAPLGATSTWSSRRTEKQSTSPASTTGRRTSSAMVTARTWRAQWRGETRANPSFSSHTSRCTSTKRARMASTFRFRGTLTAARFFPLDFSRAWPSRSCRASMSGVTHRSTSARAPDTGALRCALRRPPRSP
jgi:hypothetical protein